MRYHNICCIYFRYERVFLEYPQNTNEMTCEEHRTVCQIAKASHLHLKYLCEKVLQSTGFTSVDPYEEKDETIRLILNIQSRKESSLEESLLAFIRRTVDHSIIQNMTKLIKLYG